MAIRFEHPTPPPEVFNQPKGKPSTWNSGNQKAPVAIETRGRKADPNSKKLLTLRLDPQVIEYFRATGEGWQTRMNDALRKAAGL
ncbi:BrnA antitoxin family protein [Rhizobium johnstonii]|uniref:BrnA antitoxin family protein n=1 Tax=Rhizobium johnstonii TaxID=3019933 RepID=UPI003F9A82B4